LHEFVTVRLRCPVCDTEFAADEVHGGVLRHRESDFRPVFEGPEPLSTHMHSCPECRYSAYRDGFETEPSDEDELVVVVDADERSLPRPSVTTPDEEDALDLRRWAASGELSEGLLVPGEEPVGADRFLLAARIHEFLEDEEPLTTCHYLLRAAWCARAAGDDATERLALREVLLRLSHVLENDEPGDLDTQRLRYLAGEVSRRSGDFGRALEFFGLVEAEADTEDEEGAFYGPLARRLRQLAAVQSDVVVQLPAARPRRSSDDDDEEEDEDFELSDDDGEPTLN
jgi:uncharacterized protein (DUF2225 family)